MLGNLRKILDNIKNLADDSDDQFVVRIDPNFKNYECSRLKGLLTLKINPEIIEEDFYLEIPEFLRDRGFKALQIEAPAKLIDPDIPHPGTGYFAVTDHIACHTVNILTGTEKAKHGDAFIDMRDSYHTDLNNSDDVVLWHPHTWHVNQDLPDDEKLIAIDAGCRVTSPYIVPWAIGARIAGLSIFAKAYVNAIPEKT